MSSRTDSPRALLTACHGFTGRYVAAELEAAGYEVIGLAHDDDPPAPGGLRANLLDRAVVRKVVAKAHADVVVHLAAMSFVAHGDVDGIYRTHVEGMWRMLQAKEPDTYVLATGRTETVRDFAALAFKAVDIELEWRGKEQNETGVDTQTGQTRVKVNPKFYRPAEVEMLIGEATHAREQLGWQATTTLEPLCRMMVEADLKRVQRGVTF